MRILRALSVLVVIVSAVALSATVPILSSYQGRAEMIQRMRVDASADALFGDPSGTPLGSPQKMIIGDPKAFLPGTGDGGVKLVSENYLTQHKIYPLQLRTVEFIIGNVWLGAGIGLVIGLLALWFTGRKQKR